MTTDRELPELAALRAKCAELERVNTVLYNALETSRKELEKEKDRLIAELDTLKAQAETPFLYVDDGCTELCLAKTEMFNIPLYTAPVLKEISDERILEMSESLCGLDGANVLDVIRAILKECQ